MDGPPLRIVDGFELSGDVVSQALFVARGGGGRRRAAGIILKPALDETFM